MFWNYFYGILAVLLIVSALILYRKQQINRKVCSFMYRPMMWIRKKIRSVNWEKASLLVLSGSLFLVMSLTLAGIWGKAAIPEEGIDRGIFEALRVAFAVFEGDSADFRDHASFLPSCVTGILAVLVPLSAIATAATLVWNYLPHHVPWFSHVWYIFSELDSNSIRLAKDICRKMEKSGDTGVFIFMRTPRGKQEQDVLDELKDLNYFFYPKNEQQFFRWGWRGARILRLFFLTENTDENFNRMEDFLAAANQHELLRPRKLSFPDGQFQHEFYLLSETESAPMLIDHLRDGLTRAKHRQVFANTELRLLDRFRAVSYDLLREKPLWNYTKQNRLNILVLGFGRIGREFFRAACSAGILPGCTTEFTLCDQHICAKLNAFMTHCSELRQSVSFQPRKLDADSDALERLVQDGNYHYVVVALGDDERNIRVASRLRRYYRRCYWKDRAANQPLICVNIEDSVKRHYTQALWKTDKTCADPLYVFGGLDQAFSKDVLMPEGLWAAARWVHRKLNQLPTDVTHRWKEYERRSSVACAAHAQCYIAHICKSALSTDGSDMIARYDAELAKLPETALSGIIDMEHRRWMAYVRSEGMQRADEKMVRDYFEDLGTHVDTLGRLTPCLTDGETMEDIQKLVDELREKYPPNGAGHISPRPFRQRDAFIVKNAAEIHQIIARNQSPDGQSLPSFKVHS